MITTFNYKSPKPLEKLDPALKTQSLIFDAHLAQKFLPQRYNAFKRSPNRVNMFLAKSLEIRNQQFSATSSLYDSFDKKRYRNHTKDKVLSSRDESPTSPNVQHNASQISFDSVKKSSVDEGEVKNEYE